MGLTEDSAEDVLGETGRGGRCRAHCEEEEKWVPVTKLRRLVKSNKIKSLEQIYFHSLLIKEYQIIDELCPGLKDEVMKIMPFQKQTCAGQRTRFKASVVVGDGNDHVGLGVKCSKEVATAIRGAIILAKLSVIPVRRGYWGNKIGKSQKLNSCTVFGFCFLIFLFYLNFYFYLVKINKLIFFFKFRC